MGLVADTAAPSLSTDNMDIVEIAVPVAEAGIHGGISKTEQVFLVTFQTRVVYTIFIGSIDGAGIVSRQHPEKVRAVRIMARAALTLPDWTVQVFLSFDFTLDISQRRRTEFIAIVTGKTHDYVITRQKFCSFGKMGRMTIAAPPFLLKRLVEYLNLELFLHVFMAIEAEAW